MGTDYRIFFMGNGISMDFARNLLQTSLLKFSIIDWFLSKIRHRNKSTCSKSKILCKAADLKWLSVLEKGVCSDWIKQYSHFSLRWQQAKAWKWPLAWFWIDWSPSLQLILLQMKSYMDVWKQCRGLHWLFSISRYFLSNLHRPLKIIIFCYYWSIIHRAEVHSIFITTTVREESQVTPQGHHR